LEKLQAGEQAAILSAESIGAELLLLDENRHTASPPNAVCGLRASSAFCLQGAERGLVALPAGTDRLRKTNFRCTPALLKATLDRFTAR
jgi:hypothetical protein